MYTLDTCVSDEASHPVLKGNNFFLWLEFVGIK